MLKTLIAFLLLATSAVAAPTSRLLLPGKAPIPLASFAFAPDFPRVSGKAIPRGKITIGVGDSRWLRMLQESLRGPAPVQGRIETRDGQMLLETYIAAFKGPARLEPGKLQVNHFNGKYLIRGVTHK